MRKQAQRDQGTCPGHTGDIKAGNQDSEAGLSICVQLSGASHSREQWYGAGRGPASPGIRETAEKRSYVKWESPKKEDPVEVDVSPRGRGHVPWDRSGPRGAMRKSSLIGVQTS